MLRSTLWYTFTKKTMEHHHLVREFPVKNGGSWSFPWFFCRFTIGKGMGKVSGKPWVKTTGLVTGWRRLVGDLSWFCSEHDSYLRYPKILTFSGSNALKHVQALKFWWTYVDYITTTPILGCMFALVRQTSNPESEQLSANSNPPVGGCVFFFLGLSDVNWRSSSSSSSSSSSTIKNH